MAQHIPDEEQTPQDITCSVSLVINLGTSNVPEEEDDDDE